MRTDVKFPFENAAWAVLWVDSSGCVRHANETAINTFGPALSSSPQLSATIWGSENQVSAEQFLGKISNSSQVSAVKLKTKSGPNQVFSSYTCTSPWEGQTYYLIQLFKQNEAPPAPQIGTENSGQPSAVQRQKLECALQLTRTVALDFNNALTSILGHTSLILSKMPSDHPWRRSLIEVEQSAEKAAEIAHDLAVFSRQEKDVKALISGNLNELMRRTVELFTPEGENKVKWSLQLEDRPYLVHFDEAKLQQALIKVMDNAIQASVNDPKFLVIARNLEFDEPMAMGDTTLPAGRYVFIEITDNGPGIPADVLPRVFEPFFTTKAGHRGLGLALVYGIISNHGGQVMVSSTPGQGTSVRIYLPAMKKGARNASFAGTDLTGNQTVLIVDDEKAVLTLGQTILSSSGYKVLTANSGHKAIDMVKEHPEIELVITDLVMPNMSGRELIGQLSALAPNVRVICSSGYMRTSRPEEEELYLAKPFTSQELLRKVKSVLTSN